jgi:glycosyltransferase involved in cell wall biosynthesis
MDSNTAPAYAPKRLLIVARRFPYNHGEVAAEAYLETEIAFLAPYFDEVLAVGTEAAATDEPTCRLPKNVVPLALGCGCARKDKVRLTLAGMRMSARPDGRAAACLATDPVETPGQFAFRGYFYARAREKYDALVKRLDVEKFTPTHVYSFWLYDTALVASWIKDEMGCSGAVSRAHRYDLYREQNKLGYLPFRSYLFDRLDRVLPCSENGHDYLGDTWKIPSAKVAVSHLGTRDLPDKSSESRQGPFKIVSCSRVVDTKRVGLIADALKILDARGVPVEWTHYGAGPCLRDVVRTCSTFSKVRATFAGALPNAEILGRYAANHYDLFVNVSTVEGLPLSIMEACGCGMPVLATDVGGTSEIVADGVNGALLPADCTAEAVADAIAAFVEAPAERLLGMRAASRDVWEREFTVRGNVAGLVGHMRANDGLRAAS